MPELQKLQLPEYQFRFRTFEQSKQIFDPIRKKFVSLTPEEWVRQNLLMYFTTDLEYPLSLINIEKGMNLYRLSKRTDLIIHDSEGSPWMLVECKAPDIKIDQKVVDQICRYNIVHKAPYLFLSNGMKHYILKLEGETYKTINSVPKHNENKILKP
ncbi:MAG: type I restriction enzyme HsdR N-terminal domain-containing protein [Bacteroidia bacterium]|nr:type I restriction enzyme HsdR N-terminal domain-containing protein [Bacteroidia bacterium]